MSSNEALSPSEFQVRPGVLPGLTLVHAHTRRSFARHTHNAYGIGVIDAGGQTSASGRGPVEAVQGEVITVNPGEVHDGVPLQGERRRWRMVYLDPTVLATGRTAPEWTLPVIQDRRLAMLFNHLFASAWSGAHATANLRCTDPLNVPADALAAEERLTLLLRHAPTTMPAQPDAAPGAGRVLARACERLAADGVPPPSLAELAQGAGVGRYQFLRAFAAAYGLPPHAWAQQARLARAEGRLARGHTLTDAALASGFADQSHMTRAFRRFRGYTPGHYAAGMRRAVAVSSASSGPAP